MRRVIGSKEPCGLCDQDCPKSDRPICVVCSSGGHLSEALLALSSVEHSRYFIVSKDAQVAARLARETVYYVVDPHVSFVDYLKNTWQSLRLFLLKRPKIVVSTGAGIAIATCLLCKLSGGTLIFVESGARVTTRSRTGRLLYPIADVFIVQWQPLLKYYPKAIYGGPLL